MSDTVRAGRLDGCEIDGKEDQPREKQKVPQRTKAHQR